MEVTVQESWAGVEMDTEVLAGLGRVMLVMNPLVPKQWEGQPVAFAVMGPAGIRQVVYHPEVDPLTARIRQI